MIEGGALGEEDQKTERDLAPALTRGLKILDLVAAAAQPLSMAEIARALDLAKSSVHGLCLSLTNGGMLERTPAGTYRLGLKIVDLANARVGSSDLASEFFSRWEMITEFSDEAAMIAVLDGDDVIYVACRNSTKSLGITFRIGMRLPACFTATGKALLSTLPEEAVRALYEGKPWTRLTVNSVANVEALLAQLKDVRSRGYSIDDGESRTHMYSIGAPVRFQDTRTPSAALAISFIRGEVTEEKRKAAINVVMRLADELSRANI